MEPSVSFLALKGFSLMWFELNKVLKFDNLVKIEPSTSKYEN